MLAQIDAANAEIDLLNQSIEGLYRQLSLAKHRQGCVSVFIQRDNYRELLQVLAIHDFDRVCEIAERQQSADTTMAQMAEALDAVDRSNADGGFMFEVSEALDAYRKLIGEG